ncbi:MAG: DUF4135 domain-containing protein [Lachnospiraceae bacterium]|nr:DUF4135 domain-containing protein [Lachnospiraceae bacterium]
MENIRKEFEKHKKAIAYAFFASEENLELLKIQREDTVCVLHLSNGKKLIYESGNMKFEKAFQKYLSWFNQNINRNNKQYIKNILSYDTCAFMEHVEHENVEDPELEKEYYARYGSLCSIVGSLHGISFIEKQIRRKRQYPVIENISELLKRGVKFVIPLDERQMEKKINKETMTSEQRDIFMEAYGKCRAFIEENAADIKILISLCFMEGKVAC